MNVFKDDVFKLKKVEYFANILPPKLSAFYELLGDKKFFCGDLATYCDFAVYHQLDLCRQRHLYISRAVIHFYET